MAVFDSPWLNWQAPKLSKRSLLALVRRGRQRLRSVIGNHVGAINKSGLFDSNYYLKNNPDVAASGLDPLEHYIVHGWRERRRPSEKFDTAAYLAAHPDVARADIDPLLHWIKYGKAEGRFLPETVPTHAVYFETLSGKAFFQRFNFVEDDRREHRIAEAVKALAAREPILDLRRPDPDVSIVLPVYGQTHYALSCLDSLCVHQSRYSAEIVVIDDASPRESESWRLKDIPWIRYERRAQNGGFIDACNDGASMARGRFVAFLNSDTRVVEGWLDELLGSFDLFPRAGMVGSKLFNEDCTLQEAGGIYWRDGSAWNYGRNDDAAHPKYSFARRVDYCSGAAIAIPKSVWLEANGFDTAYKPAYAEDADLAFRLRESGWEVWMQPLSRVIHYEGKTHGRDVTKGVKAYQTANMQRLARRFSGAFLKHRPAGLEPDKEANRLVKQRLLVIDAITPTPDRDSGSFITWRMLQAFQRLGYEVTFVPHCDYRWKAEYTEALQRVGIERLHAPYFNNIQDVLNFRHDFDVVLVFRFYVMSQVGDALRSTMSTARIIFHNVDLHYLREQREAELQGSRSGKMAAALTRNEELQAFARADCNIVHTPVEKEMILNELPLENILEFPYISEVYRNSPDFSARHDIMFLGGFGHPPNVDAIKFFVENVWGNLLDRLPDDARLLVVGNTPSPEVLALADERIIVTGHVRELKPWFDQSRVFVAPLRFGAGIKGKVIQSLSYGVPTVASTIAVEGIGLRSGQEIIVADDPDAIADSVVRLYRDPDVWNQIRQTGLSFVESNFSAAKAMELCSRAIDIADSTWLRRQDVLRRRALRRVLRANGDI